MARLKYKDENGNFVRIPCPQDVKGKADKVTNATENNFASLDASGNLRDSSFKASDFLQMDDDEPTNPVPVDADLLQGHDANYFASKQELQTVEDKIPTKTSELTNDSGFLTEHQSLSNYDTKEEVNTKVSNATTDMATQTWVKGKGYLTSDDSSTGEPVPINADTLQNHPASYFATQDDLDGYATEQWVEGKGYLTEHQDISSKLSEPSSGLAVGKYFRIASIDENGHAVLECVDAPSGGVSDVKAGGVSILVDGVAVLTKANDNYNSGLSYSDGTLKVSVTTADQIKYRSNNNFGQRYAIITSGSLDYSVRAAITDGKGTAWTDTEKQGAWTRQSIIKTSLDNVLVPLAQYYLGEQSTLNLVMPTTATIGQEIIVCFSSGATACQLTCDLEGFDFVPKANKSNKILFTLVHKADVSIVGDEDIWNVEVKEG